MALTYYDKQVAKVAIMWELQAKGWKVYGYKPDQSDSMTDYFNPASWEGITEKNGYVLLVDICEYDLQYSGKQITKKTYTIDYNKLHRLESLMNDPASSENEKAVCRAKIETMKQKEKENTVIIEQYPTFKHANPKKCSWHIEKDGEIIAKGTGVFSVYDSNEKEMQKKAAKFVERIEKAISNNSQLKAVQVEEVKKVVKPVEINIPLSQFEKDKTHIKLNATFTGGNYKGSLYVLKRTYEFRNSMRYEFVKLGKRLQPLSTYNGNNILVLDEKGLQKYLANGDIVTVELKEVEEVTYKTVYKKTARKPQQSNLLTGETVEPTQQEQPQQMDNTATKKQRYALYIASNRKIDTRNIIISKEKASELISRSMQGEDIANELQAIAEGKQTEEVTELVEATQECEHHETLADAYNVHKSLIDLIATNRQFNDTLRMTDLKPYVVTLQNAYYDVKENKKYSFVQPVDVHNAVNALLNSELFHALKSEYVTKSEHDNTQQAEERLQTESKEQPQKIKVKSITFLWSESPVIKDNTTVTTWEEANKIIKDIAFRVDKGYDKTAFRIEWEDNSTYEGRIDVQASDLYKNAPLSEHVENYALCMAGMKKIAGYTQEEYENLLNAYNSDREAWKEFIDSYMLYDEETPKNPTDPSDQSDKRNNSAEDSEIAAIVTEETNSLQEVLFYHEALTEAQNTKINEILSRHKDNNKFTFVAVYKCKSKPYHAILHVINELGKDQYFYFTTAGLFAFSTYEISYYDHLYGVELLHTLGNEQEVMQEETEKLNNTLANESPEDLQADNTHNSDQENEPNYPDINIYDIESYVIDKKLSEAENAGHWIFRTKERDHTKEIQGFFADYNSKVLEVLEQTDNERIKYYLKKSLQTFKKRYFENYVKRLRNKADNPSIWVTGRAGRNVSRYNKLNNQYDKLMAESIELMKQIDRAIDRAKNEIRRDKEQHIKEAVKNIKNDLTFTVMTKEIEYMGYKERKRVYMYGEYWTAKLWGCYRIFKGNQEVHILKTTQGLEDAKQYIAYLVQQEKENQKVS